MTSEFPPRLGVPPDLVAAGVQAVILHAHPAPRPRLLWPDAHIDLVLHPPLRGRASHSLLVTAGLQWRPAPTPDICGPSLRVRLSAATLPRVSALCRQPPDMVLSAALGALDAGDGPGALEATVTWLQRHFAAGAPGHLQQLADFLDATPTPVPMATLEDLTQRSERTLQRLCRTHLGCTVSAWQGLIRFERALLALAAQSRPALAELAHDSGYADQAHLCREVRRFTGRTPLALWREVRLPESFKTSAASERTLGA